jgi:AbrB family looped-hinge helix DNA binding protein
LPVRRRHAVRITSKGQVTIPLAVREAAGFLPETEVEFVVEDDGVRTRKVASSRRADRGSRAVCQPEAWRWSRDDEHGRDHGPDEG